MEKQGTSIFHNTVVVWGTAMLCCALWGSAFACVKKSYQVFDVAGGDTASQILLAGCRFLLAGLIVIAVGSMQQRHFLFPARGHLRYVAALSLFQTVGQYAFFFIALAHMSGVKASIMDGMNSFIAILIAVYVFRQEIMTRRKVVGCLLGFVGLVLVTMDGSTITWEFHLLGEGAILLSAISASTSTALIRRFTQHADPVMLSGYQFTLGGLVMILLGLVFGGHLHLLAWWGIPLLVYMACISSVAYTLWGVLLKYNPVSKISIFGFTTQIFGVAISAVVLAEYEKLQPVLLLSLALVCAGIYIVNRGEEA